MLKKNGINKISDRKRKTHIQIKKGWDVQVLTLHLQLAAMPSLNWPSINDAHSDGTCSLLKRHVELSSRLWEATAGAGCTGSRISLMD